MSDGSNGNSWLASRYHALMSWLRRRGPSGGATRTDWADDAVKFRGTMFGIILLVSTLITPGKLSTNLAIFALGSSLGWWIGVLLSPWGPEEKSEFSSLLKAILAFVSGYLLGKSKEIITAIGMERLTDPMIVRRLLLFASSYAVGAVIVFIARRYSAETRSHRDARANNGDPPTAIASGRLSQRDSKISVGADAPTVVSAGQREHTDQTS